METIRIYLDNIFRALPQTEQVLRVKADLINDMEAKYGALRAEGKSDAQAVSQVIGEFGNIDELLMEMGIERPDPAALPLISLHAAHDFIARTHRAAHQVAIAVMGIILSVAVMIGWYGRIGTADGAESTLSNVQSLAPVIFLLVMVAACVAVIIRSHTLLSDHHAFDEGAFMLDYDARMTLERERAEAHKKSIKGIMVGVTLCILAPALLISIIAVSEAHALYGVCLLLALVAPAVYLFIHVGGVTEPYNKLLMLEDYRPENRANTRKRDALIGFLWMIAVAIFLGWGFITDGWKISWVVFPIAGVLTGAIASLMERSP